MCCADQALQTDDSCLLGLPSSELAIARMDPGREFLLGGDSRVKLGKQRPHRFVKRSTQRFLVLSSDPPDLLESFSPLPGEIKRMGSSIRGIVAPLQQFSRLEFIKR